MLKKAGSRLTKPKLSAAYGQWRVDWQQVVTAELELSHEQKTAREAAKAYGLQQEVNKLRKELEDARMAMLNGSGREAELQRLAEEQLEREREKRVEHLKQVAIRRIALKDLARGWMGWHSIWNETVRQRILDETSRRSRAEAAQLTEDLKNAILQMKAHTERQTCNRCR